MDLLKHVNDRVKYWERYTEREYSNPMDDERYDFRAFAHLGYWYAMQTLLEAN